MKQQRHSSSKSNMELLVESNKTIVLLHQHHRLPMIQVKERGLLQIRALCSSLHLQFTQTPAILDISLLSSFIHLTDTPNLNNCIKLQWNLCFIYPLVKVEKQINKSFPKVIPAKIGNLYVTEKKEHRKILDCIENSLIRFYSIWQIT